LIASLELKDGLPCYDVRWSPDGKYLACTSLAEEIEILTWDPKSSEKLVWTHSLSGHHQWVNSVDFSPNGNFLVSGSGDAAVWIWDMQTESVICKLTEHVDSVHVVRWSLNGNFVASASHDGSVCVWKWNGGKKND